MNRKSIAGIFLSAALMTGQTALAAENNDVAVANDKPDVTCNTYKNETRHVLDDESSEKMRNAFVLLIMALSKTGTISAPKEKPGECLPVEKPVKMPEVTVPRLTP